MLMTLNQLWQIFIPLNKQKLLLVLALMMIMALIEASAVGSTITETITMLPQVEIFVVNDSSTDDKYIFPC